MIDPRMALNHSSFVGYLLCFTLLFVNIYGREYVPVLIWESGDTSEGENHFPALLKWKMEDFSDLISRKVNHHHDKPLIVVFTEENLSVEDFSSKDELNQGSFPKLESLTVKFPKVTFLPSVNSPIRAFKSLATLKNGYTYKLVDLANDPITSIDSSSNTVLVIKLDGAKTNEDRREYLRRHDQVIHDIYNQLISKHSNTIAVYTGHYSSFSESVEESGHRVRRLLATGSESNETRLWRDSENKIFFYVRGDFPKLSDISKSNNTVELKDPYDIKSDERDSLQRLIAKFKTTDGRSITLRFRFPSTPSGYWSFKTIEYGDSKQELALTTSSKIGAPFNFSYHCGDRMEFRNGTTTLTLSNIQVQPFLQAPRFSDAYDCVWFFTPAIWSGLFITAILAFILIWGIGMIMDIKTMDRFDDPKGKTITIGAID